LRCTPSVLQCASPGKQRAPNPPEEVLEDPFGAFRLSSAGPHEPGSLSLPHHLLVALSVKKQE